MRTRETRKDNAKGQPGYFRKHGLTQSLRDRSMSVRFNWCMTVLVFAAVLFSSEVVSRLREAEEASQRHAATLAFASGIRARVDRELNSVLYLSSGIVGYVAVRHDQIDPQEMERILKEVYGFGRHIRNFAVAIGFRITHIYPREGNESALGRDYRELAAQWPAVKTAVDSGGGVLTGPVRLVQGGSGLIYRIPVYVNGKYWGLLSTVIDMASFEKAVFRGVEQDRFEFAIRSEEPAGLGGGILFGRPQLFSERTAVQLEADVPNGKWIYAVRPTDAPGTPVTWAVRLAGLLFALLAAAGVHTVLRQRSELARHAGVDALTGLPNRRLFDDRLEQAIRRQTRSESSQVAVVFLDLNGFKLINDQYGHRFGDAVLSKVAARVRDEVRIGDTVARWAGDEFAVIVESAGEVLVGQLIRRLRRRIAGSFEVEGVTLSVTASIGASFYPGEAATAAELLELADQRMFADKGNENGNDGGSGA